MATAESVLLNTSVSSNGHGDYGSNSVIESGAFSVMSGKLNVKASSFFSSLKLGTSKEKTPTLLEKARLFREENPDVWEAKCKRNERLQNEYNGIHEPDPFLESYYQRVDEILTEERKKKDLEKLEPPKLYLKLVFNLPREKGEENSEAIEPYKSLSRNLCIFDHGDNNSIFDLFKNDKVDDRGAEPELIVTARKAKFLNNNLKAGQMKYTSSRLKCCLFGDNGKRKQKHRTDFIYVSKVGKASWSHVFVLKGYTQEELRKHHITFKITAKSEDDTVVIGEVVMAGKDAKILEHGAYRPPTPEESEVWQKVIDNPGETDEVKLEFLQEQSFEQELTKKSSQEELETNDFPEDEESNPGSPQKVEKKRKHDSLKKSSGIKRILPRLRSHDTLSSSNESNKVTINKKNLTVTKSASVQGSPKRKLEQNDSFSSVKTLMSRMIFSNTDGDGGKSKVTADKVNKLPPSSKMKVTTSTPEHMSNVLVSNSDGESGKIKVTADKVNKLPPSSKMKVTPTKPEGPSGDKKDDSS